ncbi:MAG: biotin-dependent carboxyltransferase family protein [Methylovirgula sp.]
MPGVLRILRAGFGGTIQDGGRCGLRRYGITPAGPMDWRAFRTANLALGNHAETAAAVEVSVGGIEIFCETTTPIGVAFCGGGFSWRRDGREVGPAARLILRPGEKLTARPGTGGVFGYFAVSGGFATPVELGSRATHTRSGIGGIDGGMLRDGDLLPLSVSGWPFGEARIVAPWLDPDPAPLRVVLGPQDDYFGAAALDAFFGTEFRLTAGDRMAYRLEGPEIAHAHGFNIVSDGIALGAIQIAGDRKPLILMADHPPTGGYPKLGHVIRADIGRLAQLRPGETCRFSRVGVDKARAVLLACESEVAATARHLHPMQTAPHFGGRSP